MLEGDKYFMNFKRWTETFVGEFQNSNNYLTDIYVNPNVVEFEKLSHYDPEVRGLLDDQENIYVWSGEAANHLDVFKHLQLGQLKIAFSITPDYRQGGYLVSDSGYSGQIKTNTIEHLFQNQHFRTMLKNELQKSMELSLDHDKKKKWKSVVNVNEPKTVVWKGLIPGQKSWALNSENVNESVLTVYHGERGQTNGSSVGLSGSPGGPLGQWYGTDNPEYAKDYGEVQQYQITLNRPYEMPQIEFYRLDRGPGANARATIARREELKQQGYDSIIMKHRDGTLEYILFDKNQAKLVAANKPYAFHQMVPTHNP